MQADWRLGAIVPAIGDNVAGPAPAAITPTTSFGAKASGGVPGTGSRNRPVTAPNTGLPREGNGTGNDCCGDADDLADTCGVHKASLVVRSPLYAAGAPGRPVEVLVNDAGIGGRG
jgi:hypothetical protein